MVEGRDDLDEGAHDVGEEGHACQHDENAKDHLLVALRTQVTVAHSGQSGDREVAGGDHLVVAGRFF